MLTKLTLTVDREVVVRAKHYAKRKHRSVSRIIEDYLRVISMDEPVGRDLAPSAATTTERLTGMFAHGDTGRDYTDLLLEALEFLTGLLVIVSVATEGHNEIIQALESGFPDFEDAVQYQCARANGCSVIITRNTVDYRNAGISVHTPREYLALYGNAG
jgi:hypothetical protein